MDRLESRGQGREVLLRRQAPHVQDHRRIRCGTPGGAQTLAPARRIEQSRIDPACDDFYVAKARFHQRATHRIRRDQREERAIVELAQVPEDRFLQPTDAVVAAVGMEVGTKVRHHGDLHHPRRLQRGPPERPLGDHMHDVRPVQRPQALEHPLGRQAHLEVRVPGDGKAAGQGFAEAGISPRGIAPPLAGTHQVDLVAEPAQAFHELRRRGGHPVDLGWIGFSHHRDPQRPAHDRELLDEDRGHGALHGLEHRPRVRPERDSRMTFLFNPPSRIRNAIRDELSWSVRTLRVSGGAVPPQPRGTDERAPAYA